MVGAFDVWGRLRVRMDLGRVLGHWTTPKSVSARTTTSWTYAAVDASTGSTTAGRLGFSLTGALAMADSVGLTLHVCDAAFALADATVNSTALYLQLWI